MIPSNEAILAALFWIGVAVVVSGLVKRIASALNRPTERELLALEKVRLEAEIGALRTCNEQLSAQVDYWRERTERYIDIELAKTHGVHEPVMTGQSAMDKIATFPGLGGAAIMEIDSSKT